jgi:hypothetical protein
MKSHADRIIEEMKVDIRREYDVLWNKIKTQFDEVRGELGLKKQE